MKGILIILRVMYKFFIFYMLLILVNCESHLSIMDFVVISCVGLFLSIVTSIKFEDKGT